MLWYVQREFNSKNELVAADYDNANCDISVEKNSQDVSWKKKSQQGHVSGSHEQSFGVLKMNFQLNLNFATVQLMTHSR